MNADLPVPEPQLQHGGANYEEAVQKLADILHCDTSLIIQQVKQLIQQRDDAAQFISRVSAAGAAPRVDDAEKLATAIAQAALKAGIINRLTSLTGPQLTLLCDDLATCTTKSIEEREFLVASVAVWREIDRLSALPQGYTGLLPETDLRKHELAAWERYKTVLDVASPAAPQEEGTLKACMHCKGPITKGVAANTWVHTKTGLTTCRKAGASQHAGLFRAEPATSLSQAVQDAAQEIWERIDSQKHLTLPNRFEIEAIISRHCFSAAGREISQND